MEQLKIIGRYLKVYLFDVPAGFLADLFEYAEKRAIAAVLSIAANVRSNLGGKFLDYIGLPSGSGTAVAAAQASAAAADISFGDRARSRIDAGLSGTGSLFGPGDRLATGEARAEAEAKINDILKERTTLRMTIAGLEAKESVAGNKRAEEIQERQQGIIDQEIKLKSIRERLAKAEDDASLTNVEGLSRNPENEKAINALLAQQIVELSKLKDFERELAELRKQDAEALVGKLDKSYAAYKKIVDLNDELVESGKINITQASASNLSALRDVQSQAIETQKAIQDAFAAGFISKETSDELTGRVRVSFRVIQSSAETFRDELQVSLQSPFENMFNAIFEGTKKASEIFRSFVTDILSAVQHLISQKLAQGVLGFLLGDGKQDENGNTNSGLLGGILKNIPIIGGFAKLFGFAQGGLVPGSGTGDIVPARLTPGEYVFSRPAVDAVGPHVLEHFHRQLTGARSFRAPTVSPIGQLSFNAGGLVPSQIRASSATVVPAIVVNDQHMGRLLHGGRGELLRFLAGNATEVRAALNL